MQRKIKRKEEVEYDNLTSIKDLKGTEHVWPACDKLGNIAVFVTAGGGYAPITYIKNFKIFELVLEYLSKLPIVNNAYIEYKLDSSYLKNPFSLVNKGVFIFDSDSFGCPYKMVEAPNTLVNLNEIDPVINSILSLNCFKSISFLETVKIKKSLIVEDIEVALKSTFRKISNQG
ncbi:hypothetical protein KKF34_02030 [Myxococcota bacterium]|nr:hypothetical protein [Myxococcota bacterium]MBU1495639.1 hypothetical protein [Myxococcota bacterium]